MRMSDWSSDVCSSELGEPTRRPAGHDRERRGRRTAADSARDHGDVAAGAGRRARHGRLADRFRRSFPCEEPRPSPRTDRGPEADPDRVRGIPAPLRSEEHTSELQSLMRISYAVFCLKKKKETE